MAAAARRHGVTWIAYSVRRRARHRPGRFSRPVLPWSRHASRCNLAPRHRHDSHHRTARAVRSASRSAERLAIAQNSGTLADAGDPQRRNLTQTGVTWPVQCRCPSGTLDPPCSGPVGHRHLPSTKPRSPGALCFHSRYNRHRRIKERGRQSPTAGPSLPQRALRSAPVPIPTCCACVACHAGCEAVDAGCVPIPGNSRNGGKISTSAVGA